MGVHPGTQFTTVMKSDFVGAVRAPNGTGFDAGDACTLAMLVAAAALRSIISLALPRFFRTS
jgi:hypothetical protein